MEEIIRLYKEGKSVRDISALTGKSVSSIFRFLKKMNLTRNKSEAQSLHLKKNGHPMEGKEMPTETKEKISKKLIETWDDEEKKKEQGRKSKERYEKMSYEEKRLLSETGLQAVRDTAKTGSKLELFIIDKLKEAEIPFDRHVKILMNDALEVDIYLPGHMLAIEIDGPSHFLPVWGEEKLEKQQVADELKHAMLKHNGVKLLRVKNTEKRNTLFFMSEVSRRLIEHINDVENLDMFTQIEVGNETE